MHLTPTGSNDSHDRHRGISAAWSTFRACPNVFDLVRPLRGQRHGFMAFSTGALPPPIDFCPSGAAGERAAWSGGPGLLGPPQTATSTAPSGPMSCGRISSARVSRRTVQPGGWAATARWAREHCSRGPHQQFAASGCHQIAVVAPILGLEQLVRHWKFEVEELPENQLQHQRPAAAAAAERGQ